MEFDPNKLSYFLPNSVLLRFRSLRKAYLLYYDQAKIRKNHEISVLKKYHENQVQLYKI